jgi:chemotaxis protein histidine kinase CheA
VDQIKSQVDQLAELSDEQVMELQGAIIGEFESYETQDTTPETVDAMTSLADMLDTVRGEVQRREVEAEELAARAAEATMRVKGEEGNMGEEEAEAEEVVPTEEPTTPAEDEPETPKQEMPAEKEEEEEKTMEFSAEEETVVVESETPEVVVEEASAISEEVTEFSTDENETAIEEASVEEVSVETPEVIEETASATEETEFTSETEETIIEETSIAPEEQEEQAIVSAAEQPFEAPADRQPVVQVIETAPVAITAGADIPGYTAGSTIANMGEVASAMEKRLHSLRRVNGGDGEQHIVASFTTQYPEYRTLTTDSESNAAKIAAVVGPEALVASGGHSTPFEVKYDIFGFGVTDRPVRDALPKFQADRGGIRFITPPALSSYADAVGVWTAATDADPQSATKTSLTVSAASENTVSTDAVTLQLQFGNLMSRAYPELISRHNELGLIQHAREAEANLLSKISAGSTAVNAHVATTEAASLIGFARDFLVQIRKAAVAYRSRHRLSTNTVLKAIVPAWIFDAMAADLALSMPGDNTLGVGEAEVRGYLASSNVDLVASLDLNVFGAQSGSAAKLLEFPDTINWYLFAEGTFLFLDGGTLDLGIIRDSSLVGTNDYKMFVETFENVAKVGIESLAITSNISVNGVAAALRDTTGGATAAAIEE